MHIQISTATISLHIVNIFWHWMCPPNLLQVSAQFWVYDSPVAASVRLRSMYSNQEVTVKKKMKKKIVRYDFLLDWFWVFFLSYFLGIPENSIDRTRKCLIRCHFSINWNLLSSKVINNEFKVIIKNWHKLKQRNWKH